jgi:hypothetical protein
VEEGLLESAAAIAGEEEEGPEEEEEKYEKRAVRPANSRPALLPLVSSCVYVSLCK